ncbi:MAG: YihY/virulence factor BrkB family protein [Gemmatimonadales bacterium]
MGRTLGRVFETADQTRVPLLASALTFDAMLAIIPLGILVLSGLGYLLDRTAYFGAADPGQLIANFLPAHVTRGSGPDPAGVAERLLETVRNFRSSLTWVMVPAFLWFGSRLFAGVRVALTQVYGARARQRHDRPVLDFFLMYFFAKLRDLRMIGVVLGLAIFSTLLSAGVALLNLGGVQAAPWRFFATGLGRVLAELVVIGSTLVLFTLLYRYASPKRLDWRGALLAGSVATIGFEIAKRLFGLYLSYIARGGVFSVDANIGAGLLFILWMWYMAVVFLLGAAAARVWEDGKAEPA